jgi:hypothetical protein
VFGIIAGFPDSVCYFLQRLGILALSISLDLLFYWCINGLLDNFLQAVFGISTDNRFAQFYRFSCAIFPWF